MAYYGYDHRSQQPRRDHDAYGASYSSVNPSVSPGRYAHAHYAPSYPSPSYDSRYAAPPQLPRRHHARKNTWPPSPSVEDEKASLAKEVAAKLKIADDDEVVARGTLDQTPIIQDVEHSDDRRFVLVSDLNNHSDADARNATRDQRRKSFAERGNMAPLRTDVDPPVFTERTPTPYAYTKPQKESLAPSPGEYFLSPEPIAPSPSAVPRSVPKRDAWEAQRDQNARPQTTSLPHGRYDSFTQPPRSPREEVFGDSDSEDTTYLRTERKPARYSFVKSDLQKEDLRTNLLDSQAKADKERSEHASAYPSRSPHGGHSSGSSKNHSPRDQSPRSSSSSLNNNASTPRPRHRPTPVETSYSENPRQPSDMRAPRPASPLRTSSPLQRESRPSPPPSSNFPPRRRDNSPPSSRPSARASPSRPSSPLSFSEVPPSDSRRVPISEADWHATYPPTAGPSNGWPEPRYNRHESLPVPMPRIDIQSPSPSRPPRPENPLPYPVDERSSGIFMPTEENYQFDHSYTPTSPSPNPNPYPIPRSPYSDSPKFRQSPVHGPRPHSPAFPYPSVTSRYSTAPEEPPNMSRGSSNSSRSKSPPLNLLDRPMPSCPRSVPSSHYNDWYTLENCPNFDICPSCYEGVFADTPFSEYFRPVRRYDEKRFCDFSSPWMRLAWLLTIKQQRQTPDLIYQLATIADLGTDCPKERAVPGGEWYGIPDQRDGVHVANFAICPEDVKNLEALCPSIRGYMTRLPTTSPYGLGPPKYTCSLRTGTKRFAKYLDLLVELDEAARASGRAPDIERFIKLAREHAFRAECARDKPFARRPWFFIPSLPEFSVCEECYDELVWPAVRDKNAVAGLFGRSTQLVPGEDAVLGSSCCLYSPRMRRVWKRVLADEDYGYLERKAVKRKEEESRIGRARLGLERWAEEAYSEEALERIRGDLRVLREEWEAVE